MSIILTLLTLLAPRNPPLPFPILALSDLLALLSSLQQLPNMVAKLALHLTFPTPLSFP